MPRITTNAQLRNDLLEAYESLKADPRRLNQVSELANTAGKVLASAKMEIEYQTTCDSVLTWRSGRA